MLPEIVPSVDSRTWGTTEPDGPFRCGHSGSAARWGISRPPWWGRPAFPWAKPKTHTEPAASCCSTPATTPCHRPTACSLPWPIRSGAKKRFTAWKAPSPWAGSLVQWFRDNVGLISTAPEIEELAATVPDNGGAYIVPAFSGLFAPYWRSDARGALVGLTGFVNKGHLARAILEATAFQALDIVEAMNKDSGVDLTSLKVDGGMVVNNLLMQFQSDILGVPVIRPKVTETTALGAAYAAGLAVGYWGGMDELKENWSIDKTWQPGMAEADREKAYKGWKKAVERTLNWVD